MLKKVLILPGLFLSFLTFSQFSDSFSDGEFLSNPSWSGDVSNFAVSIGELQLLAPAIASTSYLVTSNEALNDAEWEFFVRMEFNPSNANFTKIYLVSDNPQLNASLNGYYVMLGNTADEVSLYRQNGATSTKIIDGLDGTLNQSIVIVKVKVTRSLSGIWELFSDVGSTGSYSSEGTVTDNTFISSQYGGVLCTYTSTRSDKFFFDDFIVTGNPYQDLTPPSLISTAVTTNTITLTFNEPLDLTSSTSMSNYEVDNGIGMPLAVVQLNSATIILTYPNFQNGIENILTIRDIEDVSGNALSILHVPFMYFQSKIPEAKDVIISEIFADPSPQIGLPDVEYIELYNRATVPFNFLNWTLSDATSTAIFPTLILLPSQYIIVTSSASVSKFSGSYKVVGLTNFPTLNNDEDILTIKTNAGLVIDSINYNTSWYRDEDKKQGGYSLEIIDPENSCGEENNWAASEAISGGTPGYQNSIFANKPDLTGPEVLFAIPTSLNEIIVSFNEKLSSTTLSTALFAITPSVSVTDYSFIDLTLRSIKLTTTNLNYSTTYHLSAGGIYDCAGNLINSDFDEFTFGVPETPLPNDICINEILFNPRPNGVDFVEVYNRSSKFFNLKNWSLSNISNEVITGKKIISMNNFLLAPNSFIAFTPDQIVLKTNYPASEEKHFFETSIPSMPDSEGSIVLLSPDDLIVDQFSYTDDLHSRLLKDREGVSLERISYDQPSSDKQNWKSAASTAGFATPGLINSNARPTELIETGQVNIEPEIFNPNDASRSFAQINYEFENSGLVANIKILDRQGRLVKPIANNESLNFSGFFRWDGDREDGSKAGPGYYIVWFEVFDLSGMISTFRKRVVMAIN